MCGIVGIIDYEDNLKMSSEKILNNMNNALHHRGPDDEGYYFDYHVAFGHKRLAIIDIHGGRQPMISFDQRYILVYNGEIYNFIDIKKELFEKGYAFSTSSDTEVLLYAYMEWGSNCLTRLNGDFSFGIWDKHKEELFLARDRLGVKPLYYTQIGKTFLFASEIKALLKHYKVNRVLSEHGLIELMASFQPLYPNTLLKDIYALEPGYHITFNRKGMIKKQYWDFEYKTHKDSIADTVTYIHDLLKDATKIRMVSDVPICGLLSGGLDSSGLCSFMSQLSPDPIKTFSVNFDDNKEIDSKKDSLIYGDDAFFARQISEYIKSIHIEKSISGQDYINALPYASLSRDLPVASGSEVGLYHLCKLVKEKATVAISGEGADEIAAGYFMFFSKEALKEKYNPLLLTRLDKMKNFIFPKFNGKWKPLKYLDEKYREFLKTIPRVWDNPKDRVFNTLHYIQLKKTLPYFLERADKLSMASSVELRVPFCDHRLAEYIFNIPSELKIKDGVEKYILREALKTELPHEVVYRKKSIFPFPVNSTTMELLFKMMKQMFLARRFKGSVVHEIISFYLIDLFINLSRRGMIPLIAAHQFCIQMLTMDYIIREYDLQYEG